MKWYCFNQNNSGGSFITDDEVCHRVVIEATTEEEATSKAEQLGIYFNGCEDGLDCDCCGDRWHSGYVVKLEGVETLENYFQKLANTYGFTQPDARLFYNSGDVKEIFIQKGN